MTEAHFSDISQLRVDAESGNAEAQFNLGRAFCSGCGKGLVKDYAEGLKWFLKSAAQGNASAQHACGFMYEKGRGISRDYIEAMKWHRKAADQGNADAQYTLGFAYFRGRGVPVNDAEALKWYLKSSDGGNINAQYGLGIYYYKTDNVLAYKCADIYARCGKRRKWLRRIWRYWISLSMTPVQIAEAKRLSSEWIEQHQLCLGVRPMLYQSFDE